MERITLDVDSAGDDILAVLFAAANPNVRLAQRGLGGAMASEDCGQSHFGNLQF